MTFIDTFLYPFLISIFANHVPELSSRLKSTLLIEDNKLKDLFTKTMIDTLKPYKKNLISGYPNIEIKNLIKAIKKDDNKLYILIENFSNNGEKNFFNVLKDNETEFIHELFITYNIDSSKIENNIGTFQSDNLLEIYKIKFVKNLKSEEASKLIFKEILKLDDIKEKITNIEKLLKNKHKNQNIFKLFKLIKFDKLNNEYGKALTYSGLGENDVTVCPFNESYLSEIKKTINLANKFIIKGSSGSGKSLLTYQVAKDYHDNGWDVYKLYKNRLLENQKLFEFITDNANQNCSLLSSKVTQLKILKKSV